MVKQRNGKGVSFSFKIRKSYFMVVNGSYQSIKDSRYLLVNPLECLHLDGVKVNPIQVLVHLPRNKYEQYFYL